MKFFNQKEDILDFQLTSHGRKMFSGGKLKPAYYSFSDDGIIYDIAASDASSSELQNSIKERILNDTPYLRTQRNFFSTSKDGLSENTQGVQHETQLSKIYSIGNISTDDQSASNLKVVLLSGDVKSFNNFLTASSADGHMNIPIPQINIDLEFKTAIDSYENPNLPFDLPVYDSVSREEIFSDGGTVYISQDQILLYIEEDGAQQRFDNFEIEVFEILDEEDAALSSNSLRKLDFLKKEEDHRINNNVLIDEDEVLDKQAITSYYPENTTDAEFYFDIFSDAYGEISQNFICQYIKQVKNKQFLTSQIHFDCEDLVVIPRSKNIIYDSGITGPEKC